MEQISTKVLTFRHISSATNEAVEYIRKRKIMRLFLYVLDGVSSISPVWVVLNLILYILL